MTKPLKLHGVVAQLVEKHPDGTCIGSELVFQPDCDWHIRGEGDLLGQIRYTDPEDFTKEFGSKTLEKVMDGEIVKVTAKPPEELSLYPLHCPTKHKPWRKLTYDTIYPYKGDSKEMLSRS